MKARKPVPYAGAPGWRGPIDLDAMRPTFNPEAPAVQFARGALEAILHAVKTREGEYEVRLVESRQIGLDAILEVTDGERTARVKIQIVSNKENPTCPSPRLRKR